MKKYYLYRHIRPDKNEVFYIGIGTISKKEKRKTLKSMYFRAYRKSGRTNYWKNIVNLNPDYEVEIIFETDSYDSINEKEIEFIKLYGRIDLGTGSLVNLNNGGGSNIGYKHTDESKIKMIKSRIDPNYKTLSNDNRRNSTKAKPVLRTKNSRVEEFKNIKEACLIYGFCQSTINNYIRTKTPDKGNGFWIYKPI